MRTKPTAAEAKQVWDSLERPSIRKVADKFAAAGRPVHHKTIWKWKRAGWPGTTADEIEKAAFAAIAIIDNAAPALTGNVQSTTADIVAAAEEAKAAEAGGEGTKPAPPDTRSNMERAEDALREALTVATIVWTSIRESVNEKPKRDGASKEGNAKMITAASTAINMAIDGMQKLFVLQAEMAAAMPGAQTVYPPGQGPYAESPYPKGFHGERDYPSRSTIAAIDQALEEFGEQGGAVDAA
jgi:hypothetical protein